MIPGTKGKIPKKKKEPVEFGAENINNTAPVKKILDYLQHKNNQAFAFYCHTIRPRSAVKENYNFHFTLTGHPIHAFADDWEGELNSGYFEQFSYKSFMPRMITSLKNIDKMDPVTKTIKMKNDWHRGCKNLRHTAVANSLLDKYESLNEEVVYCPKHFVDIAAHLDSDPDPYFDDSYNWYYAGNGNLQLMCVDWVDYLLHAEFSTLYLTQFSKNQLYLKPGHSAIFECEGNNILETICSPHNIVVTRTKFKVYILKVICFEDKMEFENIKTMESELPFTSIAFDNYHKNILYVTTLNNRGTIVNLDRLTGRTINLRPKLKSIVNNWNGIISSDRITFTHISRNSICIYDKRTNSTNCTWNSIRDVTDHLGCNDITVARQYKDSASLHYATDHHLFLLDLRYQSKFKPKPILRWTHGMQCAPTYMSFSDFEFNKELICLCSQWCEDMCLIPNYNRSLMNGVEITSVTMPFRPPSILDTLNQAKENLLCLDVYKSIDNRLATSITGHLIAEHEQNYVVLMHNSLGDISCHYVINNTLYPEHVDSFVNDDSIQHLHDWSKSYKPENKPFEVSSVVEISGIWKGLKKISEEYRFCESDFKSNKTKKFEKEVQDTFENEELDAGLLDVWIKDTNEISVMEGSSSLAINLHYSGDESLKYDSE